MSFYTFATSSLTTSADRRRRPALDKGQLIRAFLLCLIVLVALALMAQRSQAAEGGLQTGIERCGPAA